MPRHRVTIAGKTYDAMADLVRKHRLNIAGHTGKKTGSGYVVHAFADAEQVERLRSEGYRVEVLEDVHEAGRRRQGEVRPAALPGPAGSVATAGQYLNVDDVESSLANVAAGPNAGFTQLLTLPSTNPCDHDVYIGPSPVSEPETKNVVWMFETFPDIRYFIDVTAIRRTFSTVGATIRTSPGNHR